MEDEKKTTETATPETTPEEQANKETEAIKALRDVYEAKLKEKDDEISAIKKAHVEQMQEILKGRIAAGDSAEDQEEDLDPDTVAARRIADKYKIRRL